MEKIVCNYNVINEYIVKIRRDLHKIPEIGVSLPMTSAYVAEKLDEMGIPYKKGCKDSSIVAMINGNENGKVIALRADMDGLPIKEDTGLEFEATNGNMHACGHDAHTAILLGVAKILNENKEILKGRVKLLFQTGEEICEGARILIEEGALNNPQVDGILGLHVGLLFKEIGLGKVAIQSGTVMASFDKFVIKIKGIGCHGATPHEGVDPITISAQVISALQTIVSRERRPTDPAVITIGKVQGGCAYNIIPDSVEIEGTVRATEQSGRENMVRRIEEIASSIAKGMNGKCEFQIYWGAPPVVNHKEFTERFKKVAERVIGKENIVEETLPPSMGGEDMAFYLEKVPGTFFFIGSGNEEKNANYPHHNPKFDIDEDSMIIGAKLLVEGAIDFLKK